MRPALALLALYVAATSVTAQPQPVWLHPQGGAPTFKNRLTILMVSEGFTQPELDGTTWSVTINAAHAPNWVTVCRSISEGLLEGEPMKSYAQLFNIGYVSVPNQDSGVTNSDTGNTTQTIFEIHRSEKYYQPKDTKKTLEKLRELAKGFKDPVPVNCWIVIVNSQEFGAGTVMYDHGVGTGPGLMCLPLNSGPDASKPIRRPKDGSDNPPQRRPDECDKWYNTHRGDFLITAVHELGHALLGLADEYGDQDDKKVTVYRGTDEPTAANLTLVTDKNSVKWKRWVSPTTGVDTPVEGGFAHDQGIYHPRHNCRMDNSGCQFCPVCKERAVQRFLAQVNFFDVASPSGKRFDSERLDTTFSVTFAPGFGEAQTSTNPLDVEWYVNNSRRTGDTAATGSSLTVKASEFHDGPNEITCLVGAKEIKTKDRPVDFVPTDVSYRRDWRVNIKPAQTGVPNRIGP